jgi:hypothetical protein
VARHVLHREGGRREGYGGEPVSANVGWKMAGSERSANDTGNQKEPMLVSCCRHQVEIVRQIRHELSYCGRVTELYPRE